MICDLIFDFAQRTPDKAAVVYNGQTLSYRSFAGNIALARGYFANRGVTGSGFAVLAVRNRLDFWVLSLALRSLGLTTVVVDSTEALDGLGLPQVRCVVASAVETWPDLSGFCQARGYGLFLVSLTGEIAIWPDDIPPPDRPGGHMLTTSGTTGVSKKVLMDPAFEAEFGRDRRAILGVTQDSVVNVFSFGGWTGIGYNSPVSAWFVGATVVIDQYRALHEALLYPGITHSMIIPDLIASILAAPAGAFPRSEIMHLSVTSGTITQAQIDQCRARITPHIFNRIGSTEVNTFANTALETAEDHRWHRLAPGRQVQIVDDFDRPAPIGVVGRVRVSAANGPNGYLHDEAATKAFFKDGFFYPGDLGLMRQDGRMALQGRVTDVINVKGYKIMPAPIEERLRQALGVSGVCLISMQDANGEEGLHVMIEAGTPLDTASLSEALRGELFGFPGVLVHYVEALPRNAMGKVVRREVVAQALASPATAPPPSGPPSGCGPE